MESNILINGFLANFQISTGIAKLSMHRHVADNGLSIFRNNNNNTLNSIKKKNLTSTGICHLCGCGCIEVNRAGSAVLYKSKERTFREGSMSFPSACRYHKVL